jgi:hypothetical protein
VERDEQRNTDDTVAAETERVVDVKEQLPWVTTIATVTPNYANTETIWSRERRSDESLTPS